MKFSRTFARDARRVIIKVGTTVVTRSDGKLAIGRIGYLCEQVKALLTKGIEVVIVSSGAVGIGRHKLFNQQLINSSFSDLPNLQKELGGNPSAAVGQNGLIALYENLLSQLDVQSSQILLMENDFKDIEFMVELRKTIDTLLELQVVPIFNENDAISNQRAPYEDLMGIFCDNDSLAALLALELKADLLILLSDVEGLYSGPPHEPGSKLIHTYIKEKHDDSIAFGEKSKVGRGGMTAKVCAAKRAAESGIPVIITSGYATDGIIRVMNGERIGTLFHKDAHLLDSRKEATSRQMAMGAKEASRQLQMLSSSQRSNILLNIADALEANENEIREKNMEDVEHARKDGVSEPLISLLTLKPGMISRLAKSSREIAGMEEPLGKVLSRKEVAENLIMEEVTCPLGVLLIIFEPRPDALVQIASLAIRSGNGLLLKGGKEASRTNSILHKVITEALPDAVGKGLIALISLREEIPDLLKLNDIIDLVIPRGSNKLVSDIKESTKIAVLGHADGVCHVYVDKSADMDKAKKIVLDAKVDFPAACNAMETLLVHEALIETRGLQELIYLLQNKGVTLYGGIRSTELLKLPKAVSFHKDYSSMACTIHVVEDVYAAINHIHKYGSTHTDCIVAEDIEVAETFLHNVDSTAVFHNASTRFSDDARFGLGAEVGISTNRIHAWGPVGVEGLLTCRWFLRGCGQIVNKKHAVVYTHNDLLTNTSTSTNKNSN